MFQGESPDHPAPEACALLDVIAREALFFLRGLVLEIDGQDMTIFQWPGGDTGELALWFLTDWWTEYGLRRWMASAS